MQAGCEAVRQASAAGLAAANGRVSSLGSSTVSNIGSQRSCMEAFGNSASRMIVNLGGMDLSALANMALERACQIAVSAVQKEVNGAIGELGPIGNIIGQVGAGAVFGGGTSGNGSVNIPGLPPGAIVLPGGTIQLPGTGGGGGGNITIPGIGGNVTIPGFGGNISLPGFGGGEGGNFTIPGLPSQNIQIPGLPGATIQIPGLPSTSVPLPGNPGGLAPSDMMAATIPRNAEEFYRAVADPANQGKQVPWPNDISGFPPSVQETIKVWKAQNLGVSAQQQAALASAAAAQALKSAQAGKPPSASDGAILDRLACSLFNRC